MAFKVEDGTGLADSNSYATYSELMAYFSLRGVSYSNLTQPEWEKLLIKATDYIDLRWGPYMKGLRLLTTQALRFPRLGLYSQEGDLIEGLPANLKRATIEYAFVAQSGSLFLTPTADATGQRVNAVKKVIGPIEKSVIYSEAGGTSTVKRYPAADNLMRDYVIVSGEVIRA